MPVTRGALLHQLVERVERLEARVAQLHQLVQHPAPVPVKKAAPRPVEK